MLFANIDEIIDGTPEEKPMTNADRINAMSIEEKATFIVDEVLDIHHNGMRETAYDGWLKWLQLPCEAVQTITERPDGQS